MNTNKHSPNLAMRLSEADKKALRLVAAHMGKSQSEAVRVLEAAGPGGPMGS